MEFKDIEISKIDLSKSPEKITLLIVKYLCAQNYDPESFREDEGLLGAFIENAKENGLDHRQFNELLLLLNQDLVGKDFFKFFFEKERVKLEDLKKGIARFRGIAMLCFGNFRFAYKRLIQMGEKELEAALSYCWKKPSELRAEFKKRRTKILEVKRIPRDKTWYLGYITGKKVEKEREASQEELTKVKKGQSAFKKKELDEFRDRLAQISVEIEEAQKQALENTNVYLTWDCIDIYFATSMRNKWEYEETFDFIEEVCSDNRLMKFSLRYFDPTQSTCNNSREKGLIEGLMLKRDLCTIYLAQESDTMGKDSELAATLAQSKPVVAYVPRHDPKKYSRKISDYPLDFFKKRLLVLDAEEVFDDPKCQKELRKCDQYFEERIDEFLTEMAAFRLKQPFSLWTEKEIEFKEKNKNFSKICQILAVAECFNFDRRAQLLRGVHPLSMQVDLQSGVANGVLVVRSRKGCADLLRRILTNDMKFTIRHEPADSFEGKEGYTALEEEISGSPFRVVIDNERLTNSFWNLFSA